MGRSQRPAANSLSCWRCTHTDTRHSASMRSCHLARVTSSEDVSSLLLAQMLSSCWLLMLQRAKQSRSHQRVDPFVDPGDQAALIINPARAQSLSLTLRLCVHAIRSAMKLHLERCFNWRVWHITHRHRCVRKRRNEMETRLRQLVQIRSLIFDRLILQWHTPQLEMTDFPLGLCWS
jgi:hypothetical protein